MERLADCGSKGALDGVGRARIGGVLVGLLAAAALGGCLVVRDHEVGPLYDRWPYDQAVYETIDADQILHTELGAGVGLFVEYYSGGSWRLWTSCDTKLTNARCTIEARVIAETPMRRVVTEQFEGYDSIDRPASDELWFYVETTYDTEIVWFDQEPGASIELELWVDGYLEPGFLFWVGGGFIHAGAVGSPLVLTPNRP